MSNLVLSVGQKVELNDSRIGIIRFLGATAFQTGEWVGLELEDATGKNDGSVQGKRYFECAPGCGIFCRASGVSRVLEEPTPKVKATANGVPVKARPSSIQGPSNGARRQTLQQDGRGALQGTPTPSGRLGSGIRSPLKSPTKQLGTNGTSSSSTSRTGTPPVTSKRPAAGPAAKTGRPSMAPPSTTVPGRRTSTLPSSRAATTRQPPVSTVTPRIAGSRTATSGPPTSKTATTALRGVQQRSAAAKEDSIGDDDSESSSALSPRESTASEAASQEETENAQDEQHNNVRNFAPRSAPPIPPEPAEKPTRPRRPSSPAAASVHSQRTIRSTAATSRQIEELEAKNRLLERKRAEDRDLRQQLEKAEQEREQYKGIIEKLQTKYRPQQQEMERLKREVSDYEKKFNELEDIQAKHDVELESALVDREYAEEQAEQYKADLDAVRQKNEEMQLEMEILTAENNEFSKEMSPDERNSAGWLQLEKSNERLREALINLRDIAQDKEAELSDQVKSLEAQVKDAEAMKTKFLDVQEQLLQSRDDTEDLRQQLEVALNAEDMIERLSEENQSLRDKISDFRATIDDLESLRELNDELDINHVEAEKQLQEEIDFKDSLLMDRERTAKEQQAALDEADYNITRFRELVTSLQSDLQDLQASKQISESEAAQLSDRSRAMMDLNHKLQSSAAKTQVKTIDLELRKLDAQQASEHLAIVQLFLPEAFQAERDSVLALLRFKRISFKSSLVQGLLKERVGSFGSRGQDEAVFAACDALDKLTWIAAMADRLVSAITGCNVEAFGQFGAALHELEVVERTLNDCVDAFRRNELKEDDLPLRLGRSIEVMTHLSGLHLHNGLADRADDLMMRAQLLQSQMESTASALTLERSMIEAYLQIGAEHDDSDDENESDIAFILNRLKSNIELTRNIKVVSGKTYRALFDLQSRHLTLEEPLKQRFQNCEAVALEIATFACQSGSALQSVFLEEGRNDPFTPSEVAGALSRTATSIFALPSPESGPYATLTARLRDLNTLLAELATLTTDLDNTVEFERAAAPWVARANELKQTKLTSVDTEAELARTIENVKERDATLRHKETELEEQSVRIEMLEARMKDASKRSAKIAELERSLRETKESESKSRNELARARSQAQNELERVRGEMDRLVDQREKTSDGTDLDGNAMGASVRITLQRQEHKIAGLKSAVRYLKEDNHRLRIPSLSASSSAKVGPEWLQDPIRTSKTSTKPTRISLRREGEKALEQLLLLASSPATVDLTKMPENKLAWRPAKESSRWKVEWRNEDWVDWKQRRDGLVKSASLPPAPRSWGMAANGMHGVSSITESAA